MVVGSDLVQGKPGESVSTACHWHVLGTYSLNVDWYVTLSPAGGVQLFRLRMGASWVMIGVAKAAVANRLVKAREVEMVRIMFKMTGQVIVKDELC